MRRLRFDAADRAIRSTLVRLVPDWRRVVWIATPDTITRWLRDGWGSFWQRVSRPRSRPRRRVLTDELRALIVRMATNPRWGAKQIVGELWTKLSIRIHKRTVQRVLRTPRSLTAVAP